MRMCSLATLACWTDSQVVKCSHRQGQMKSVCRPSSSFFSLRSVIHTALVLQLPNNNGALFSKFLLAWLCALLVTVSWVDTGDLRMRVGAHHSSTMTYDVCDDVYYLSHHCVPLLSITITQNPIIFNNVFISSNTSSDTKKRVSNSSTITYLSPIMQYALQHRPRCCRNLLSRRQYTNNR